MNVEGGTINTLSASDCDELFALEQDVNLKRACIAYLEWMRLVKTQRISAQITIVSDVQNGNVKEVRPGPGFGLKTA